MEYVNDHASFNSKIVNKTRIANMLPFGQQQKSTIYLYMFLSLSALKFL